MLPEAIDGVLALPAWVQGFLAFFVLCVVVMIVEIAWLNRRVTRRFAALASASGAAVKPAGDKFAESFEVERDGRRFTVGRHLRDTTMGPYARGPRGQLIICETQLAGVRWQRHGVDIGEEGAYPPVGSQQLKTGDATFDERFTAWEVGELVREGWLDAATRSAVTAFFDTAALSGSLWVRNGMLEYIAVAPKGMEPSTLPSVLRALSAVALAFEHTAGWRASGFAA